MSKQVRYPSRTLAGGLMVAALLVTLWGCNNPNGQGNGCASTGADVVINAQDNQTFDKPSLTITRGQTVCWQNFGTLTHTVTATSAIPSDSSWTASAFDHQLSPNLIVIHTFAKAGQYSYHCLIHSGMTGLINVP
jgi:plastocyanin